MKLRELLNRLAEIFKAKQPAHCLEKLDNGWYRVWFDTPTHHCSAYVKDGKVQMKCEHEEENDAT
jgi:hypothetical protein